MAIRIERRIGILRQSRHPLTAAEERDLLGRIDAVKALEVVIAGNGSGKDKSGLAARTSSCSGWEVVGGWNRRLLRALEGTAEEQGRGHELGGNCHAGFVCQ